MRVVVTGGGTGGHVYPALAIAQGLLKARPGIEVLYIGTHRGLEAEVVTRAGLPLATITVQGLERRRLWKNFQALARLGRGIWEAYKLLRCFQPQVVVGTGGYVCAPVCVVAAALRIPIILHEQNAFPGLTNRWLARVARTVCLTFPEAKKYFPSRVELITTGLPVRPEIISADRGKARAELNLKPDQFFILIVGGSQGARSLNQAALSLFRAYQGQPSLKILHVAGRQDYERLKAQAEEWGIQLDKNGNITIVPYLHDIHIALAAADLVIGRAGASFLAEVLVRGLPTILIPYPYAASNHQEYNARAVAKQGAAIIVRDSELTTGKLLRTVESLLADPEKLKRMAQASARLGRPDALEKIVTKILALAEERHP
ncbi:UDP-N-acetylglucosamine-N-acetylmuramylpentapeptide N-acetylglucosamine transferase [Thermanaeromonas toyohensis ToBE]|uniref:UDP-N-acetylglucosamine--N-acetylmuramyl-(pentapeptide) pyrophosphoryl-undecaprenol N-acetylglucosamine transferase n=1 Tax=Thermanaeromonas toyohensis ToBE TaxID=698762 RepID=A0A1W1VLS9_9FIRM|nr:undecaprenyldiphospho-muramoylpentapeptide beta-N-acetylglucosaminyltransferase [Thermanaeromonas toyohensis]SMB94339.1 UDP-N-acetylglucosamine-N-acetylmuramylpentapeptide N-acetylglucosamine transferase [Thermanaeromonas toyohensis ToBE]